ncbi:hypothetical protein Q31b_01740 [Novipirellula aureliae]|uniref:Uncharacterized protein n=1 Tax=Novipirellula aureliae TaxID=2527966 RepID=A0A5C6E5Q2_9BACT|nr:hypothetical protein Q31b_01740 [Novipirellula aureliae]
MSLFVIYVCMGHSWPSTKTGSRLRRLVRTQSERMDTVDRNIDNGFIRGILTDANIDTSSKTRSQSSAKI